MTDKLLNERLLLNVSGNPCCIFRYSVHQQMFSTSGDIILNVGGYHVYIGGCSVHRRNTISTLEGRDIMSTWGGGEGYHE